MTNFSDWQLKNISEFGIKFPRFQKIELSSVQIQSELFNMLASPDFKPIFRRFVMTNFSDWQLKNISEFGIKFPRFQKIELSSVQIQDEFDKVASEVVNPLSDNGGSLGHCWYEWLAEATASADDHFSTEEEKLLYAARHFSWEFPQVKMVIHSVRIDSEIEPGFYTDGYYFTVEFY